MTATECINYIDAIEPNAYTSAQKLRWVSECEGKVYTNLFLVQPYEFTPVTDGSRILALPAPYDRIYPRYLQAMIHYANGEYDRYANSMAVFNEAWGELNRWFGGDYDVTDRLRNKRFEAVVTLEPHDTAETIMEIPEGCAVVAGRIVIREEADIANAGMMTTDTLAEGTYNFKAGKQWYNFTTTNDYASGSDVIVQYDGDSGRYAVKIMYLDGEDPAVDTYTVTSGKDSEGTDLRFDESVSIEMDENELTTFRVIERGVIPLPMLLAGYDSAVVRKGELTNCTWLNSGNIVFTGHLLIPDERWSYEDRYARRRDARWHG